MSGIPIIETLYSETYKRINVAGIFGGIIAGGSRGNRLFRRT